MQNFNYLWNDLFIGTQNLIYGWMTNSGFVAVSTAYNNNHWESVLLVPMVFFCPSSIIILHVAAIFVAVHMIAERKITLELSLSFMLTGKWCIDSFVYSALCMDDGQKNLSEKCTGVSACFSLSPCRRSQSCSYHHYALSLHCSHSVAWQRGSVGTCNVSVSREWDGHGRLVGRLVDAVGPVDHEIVWGSLRLDGYQKNLTHHWVQSKNM